MTRLAALIGAGLLTGCATVGQAQQHRRGRPVLFAAPRRHRRHRRRRSALLEAATLVALAYLSVGYSLTNDASQATWSPPGNDQPSPVDGPAAGLLLSEGV